MTTKGPLDKLSEVFGGNVREKNSPSRQGRALMYTWEAEGHRAVDAVEQMLPFFVIRRRHSLGEILARYPFLEPGKRLTEVQSKDRAMKIEAMHRMMVRINKTRDRRVTLKRRMPSDPTENDYAYLAGLLDSQGGVRQPGSTAMSRHALNVDSTDAELIRWLWRRFGGAAHPDYRRKTGKHRPCSAWRCTVTETRRFAPKILDRMQNPGKAKSLAHWQTHVLPRGPREDTEKDVRVPSRWGDMFQ